MDSLESLMLLASIKRPPPPLLRETYPFFLPPIPPLPYLSFGSSPMAIEAQPISNTPPVSHSRPSLFTINPRSLACIPVVLSYVVQSVIIVYVYIFLCSFHLLYSSSIRAISLTADDSSGPSRWQALSRSVTKICYTTLATGLSCLWSVKNILVCLTSYLLIFPTTM